MRNPKVRFRNCDRFSLGGNDDVVIEPTSTVQMILGTNGSGKSSLSAMGYTPYPPSHTDFTKGGFWEYKCEHHGSHYVLYGDMDKKRYSFIKDELELNESGNITTQVQLTLEHFGIDRQLNEILTGRADFVSMTSGQRSSAISRVSKVDFSYAFSKYSEWRRGYNSSTSVVKYISGRLTDEKEKLLSDEDKALLEGNVKTFNETLGNLMELDRSLSPMAPQELQTRVTALQSNVDRYFTSSADFLRLEFPKTNGLNHEGLSNLRAVMSARLEDAEGMLSSVGQDLDKISNIKGNIVSTVEGTNIEDMEKKISHISELIEAIPSKSIDIPDDWLVPCDGIINELSQYVSKLGEDPDEDVSKSNQLRVQLDETSTKINRASSAMYNLEERLRHLTSINFISCPGCNHQFRPGVDQSEVTALEERKTKGEQYITSLNDTASELGNQHEQYRESEEALKSIHALRERSYTVARGLYSYIDSLGGFSRGRGLLPYLSTYKREIDCREKRGTLQRAFEHATLTLEAAKGKIGDYDKVISEFDTLESKYKESHSVVTEIRNSLKGFDGNVNYLNRYISQYESVDALLESIRQEIIVILGAVYMNSVNEEISKVQNTLAVNVNALSNNELIEAIIDDLEKQFDKARVEQKAFKLLVDTMDPKTGLIADQIKLQIGTIVDGMNRIIEKIWSYPLKILMPENDDGKLDYKFPILVNGKRRSDVSEGSSSMRVIVNSTFSILTHYSLGLQGYNVHLDEFDGTFDGAHTENVIGIIKELAESGKFGHVIVVSHDDRVQNAFPTADTIVLDKRNLEKSKVHEFEY